MGITYQPRLVNTGFLNHQQYQIEVSCVFLDWAKGLCWVFVLLTFRDRCSWNVPQEFIKKWCTTNPDMGCSCSRITERRKMKKMPFSGNSCCKLYIFCHMFHVSLRGVPTSSQFRASSLILRNGDRQQPIASLHQIGFFCWRSIRI